MKKTLKKCANCVSFRVETAKWASVNAIRLTGFEPVKTVDDQEIFRCPDCGHAGQPVEIDVPVAEVTCIELHRREGEEEKRVISGPSLWCWSEAARALRSWGETAPEHATGTYDKVDFLVTWSDGETYRGRFDLQKGGLNDQRETLGQQITQYCRFFAGYGAPRHLSHQQYQERQAQHEREGRGAEARLFLEMHEIIP